AAYGLFSSVNFRFTTSAAGDLAITFQVAEAPTYPISYDNFAWFSDAELSDAIRADLGVFTGEVPDGGAMVDEITAVLTKQLYLKNIKGTVTHLLLAQAVGDGMMMQFRVEGPTIRIQSVHIGDSVSASSEALKDRVSDLKGQPYSRFAIELFEFEQIR